MKFLGMLIVCASFVSAFILLFSGAASYYGNGGLHPVIAGTGVVLCLLAAWFAAWVVDLEEEQGR